MSEKKNKTTTKVGFGFVLGWIIGVILIVSGAVSLFSRPYFGFFAILAGLAVFPPFWQEVKNRYDIEFSGVLKVVALFFLIALGGSFSSGESETAVSTVGGSPSEEQLDQQQSPQEKVKDIEVVSIDTKVTESNSVWWKYSWVLVLKNNTSSDKRVRAEIKWVDSEGFVIDSSNEWGLEVSAGEEKTFNDFILIDADVAPNVDQVQVEID